MTPPADEALRFECPRCGEAVEERFYGPCGACRTSLVSAYDVAPAEAVVASRFEPRMNVVPNHVATRD